MSMIQIIAWIQTAGIVLATGLLAMILFAVLLRPRGSKRYSSGAARKLLSPAITVILAVSWILACIALWRPIPFDLGPVWDVSVMFLGAMVYFAGLALYVWGFTSLGESFAPSSSFGVQIKNTHKLVIRGPFALIRHPMYLGLITSAIGGILLYQNWTFVFISVCFLFLPIRAKKEEEFLQQEYGKEWRSYTQKVPPWFPHR